MFRTGKRHKLTSEAGKRNERGVDPTICEAAADRVAELLDDVRRRHRRARRDASSAQPPAAPTITIAVDLPARVTGMDIAADTTVAQPARPSAATSTPGRRHADRDRRRRGAPTSPTPSTWSRRSPGSSATTTCPSVLPTGAVRPRADPRASGCAAASAARWPAPGCVEVVSFPFVGEADLDALGLPADDPRRTTLRLANPLSQRGAGDDHHAAARACSRTVARNVGRGTADLALFETATVTLPRGRGSGADPRRRPAARPTASSTSSTRRSRTSRCTSAVVARR